MIRRFPLWRFIKYGVTGLLNTGISYVIYSLLVFVHLNAHWGVAIGYVAGMGTSYLVNSVWTFQHRLGWVAGLRFLVVNLLVLAISEGSLTVMLHVVSASPYVAQAVNLIPTVIIGFLLNQWIVFRDHKEPLDAQYGGR